MYSPNPMPIRQCTSINRPQIEIATFLHPTPKRNFSTTTSPGYTDRFGATHPHEKLLFDFRQFLYIALQPCHNRTSIFCFEMLFQWYSVHFSRSHGLVFPFCHFDSLLSKKWLHSRISIFIFSLSYRWLI